MTKQEFDAWKIHTKSSETKWTIDPVHNGKSGQDLLVHKGGVDGNYFMIHTDGLAEFGTYTGALPHIGEAMFKVTGTHQCKNFEDALSRLFSALGINYLIDFILA